LECPVSGSGFIQAAGTLHFRATFLAAEELLPDYLSRITWFHRELMDEFGDEAS
jgi:hypothetical protein